jgi:hypothetical protein
MALILDTSNQYNSTANHDYKMTWCASWVDHYNFLAGISFNTEAETAMYKEEMAEYLCYDV